jgi:CBS domain-containing membrane protein
MQKTDACMPVDISDEDVYEAMKEIAGYLDITPGDFAEVYRKAHNQAIIRLTRSIKAADVMTGDVISVQAKAPLSEVAEIMAQNRISGVPVLDETRSVIGMISEKDFLSAMGGAQARTFMDVIAQCLSGSQCLIIPVGKQTAADLMKAPAITVPHDMPAPLVAGLLTREKINRVPVLDDKQKMVGIVSRADILRSGYFPEAT